MKTITDTRDLGAAVRAARRTHGDRQEDVAAAAGVGLRFVGELERGKPTARLAEALRVVTVLGLKPRLEDVEVTDAGAFGAAVRATQRKLGYRQEDVAAAAGVGVRFVGDLERGKPSVQLGKALRVARTLGLGPLITGNEDHDAQSA